MPAADREDIKTTFFISSWSGCLIFIKKQKTAKGTKIKNESNLMQHLFRLTLYKNISHTEISFQFPLALEHENEKMEKTRNERHSGGQSMAIYAC